MSVAPSPWRRQREVGSHAALRLMRWLSLGLGRAVSRWVLPLIALYYLVAAPAPRRASSSYLARALPRQPTARDTLRHFHCFASTVHDRAYLLTDRFDAFDIQMQGVQHVDRLLADGAGGFLVGAHLGSFEVLRAVARGPLAGGRPYPIAMAMYEDNARQINAALAALPGAVPPQIIALGRPQSMLEVREALAANTLVGFLADRRLGGEPALSLPFLGATAHFPLGPFRLAAALRSRMLLMLGLYLGGARYEVSFVPLADFRTGTARSAAVEEAAHCYAARLEAACRAHPYNWFNFYDFWAA
ncbi:MAG: acyl-CoA synthetase [Betaproteobacteria bacterium]